MILQSAGFVNYSGGPFPNFSGKNATGAGATDGTEWIAAYIDNWGWGWQQALMDHESLTPNGVTEVAGASQILDAIQMLLPPGAEIIWNLNADPGTLGYRFLLLNGQGILRANYPDLDTNVYVGDANNAAVAAAGGGFYRADDAAGTIPNIAGIYLILPESRGYAIRGLDKAASIDPQGASRVLGDNQLDAFQGHWHLKFTDGIIQLSASTGGTITNGAKTEYGSTDGISARIYDRPNPVTDGTNGTPRNSSETRMVNRSVQFAIRY